MLSDIRCTMTIDIFEKRAPGPALLPSNHFYITKRGSLNERCIISPSDRGRNHHY